MAQNNMLQRLQQQTKRGAFRVFDIGVYALLLAAVLLFVFLFPTSAGKQVKVFSNQKLVYTAYLNQDQTYMLTTYAQDGAVQENYIVICDGYVLVKHANCPNQNCVNMGATNLAGRDIICLAHQVVVQVVGDSQGLDAEV